MATKKSAESIERKKLLGKKIKAWRLYSEFTQDAMAFVLGVTPQTVSSWEKGRTEPDMETLIKMCNEVFSCTFSQFLSEDDPEEAIPYDMAKELDQNQVSRAISALPENGFELQNIFELIKNDDECKLHRYYLLIEAIKKSGIDDEPFIEDNNSEENI